MYKQPTFGRPASFQMPSTFARSSDKREIMEDYGLSYWFQRRIPRPGNAERFKWSPGALIANLPSVIQTGAGASGATRGLLPQRTRDASGSSGDGVLALDSHGQAQPPLAEQPQRTREEPYFSQRPLLNLIRTRLRRT